MEFCVKALRPRSDPRRIRTAPPHAGRAGWFVLMLPVRQNMLLRKKRKKLIFTDSCALNAVLCRILEMIYILILFGRAEFLLVRFYRLFMWATCGPKRFCVFIMMWLTWSLPGNIIDGKLWNLVSLFWRFG